VKWDERDGGMACGNMTEMEHGMWEYDRDGARSKEGSEVEATMSSSDRIRLVPESDPLYNSKETSSDINKTILNSVCNNKYTCIVIENATQRYSAIGNFKQNG
jgi:hypothetical protein